MGQSAQSLRVIPVFREKRADNRRFSSWHNTYLRNNRHIRYFLKASRMLGVHRIWPVSAVLLLGCLLAGWRESLSAGESVDWADALAERTASEAEVQPRLASAASAATEAVGESRPTAQGASTSAAKGAGAKNVAKGNAGPRRIEGPAIRSARADQESGSPTTLECATTLDSKRMGDKGDSSFLQHVLQPPPVPGKPNAKLLHASPAPATRTNGQTHSQRRIASRHHHGHSAKAHTSRRRSSRRVASRPTHAADRHRAARTGQSRSQFAEALATDEQPNDWIAVSDQTSSDVVFATANHSLTPAAHYHAALAVQDDGSVSVTDAPALLNDRLDPIATDEGEVWVSDGSNGACADCEESTGLLGLGGGGLRSRLQQWAAKSPSYGNLWLAYPRSQTVWVRTKYLYWETDGDDLPPLVTTSTPGTADDNIGVLGLSTTQVLFGQQEVNDGPRHGGRIEFGIGQFEGLQFDLYALDEESYGFFDASTGSPFLARPFFNIELLQQDASILACPSCTVTGFPNINLQGSIHIETTSEVRSAGVSWRRLMWMDTWAPFNAFVRLNFLAGYRYFKLREGLAISDAIDFIGAPFQAGTRLSRLDIFDTSNEFHGGELGWLATIQRNRWSVDLLARLAMGNMQQVVDIAGFRTLSNGTTSSATPAGFLTQASNSGRFVHDEFALIPELGVDIGFQLTDRVKLTFGYSFVYVSQATRPGDNIDLTLNESTAGGLPSAAPARPLFTGSDSDFWAGGGTAGIEWRW